jgi:hypothetical protein
VKPIFAIVVSQMKIECIFGMLIEGFEYATAVRELVNVIQAEADERLILNEVVDVHFALSKLHQDQFAEKSITVCVKSNAKAINLFLIIFLIGFNVSHTVYSKDSMLPRYQLELVKH